MSDDGWKEAAQEYHEQRASNGGNGRDRDESEIIQLEINRLARLNLVDYERERAAAAERLEMRASILDRVIEAERKKSGDGSKQGRALKLPEPAPWPDPVDGAQLLRDLSSAIRRYVIMPDHMADACALWATHTYSIRCHIYLHHSAARCCRTRRRVIILSRCTSVTVASSSWPTPSFQQPRHAHLCGQHGRTRKRYGLPRAMPGRLGCVSWEPSRLPRSNGRRPKGV